MIQVVICIKARRRNVLDHHGQSTSEHPTIAVEQIRRLAGCGILCDRKKSKEALRDIHMQGSYNIVRAGQLASGY